MAFRRLHVDWLIFLSIPFKLKYLRKLLPFVVIATVIMIAMTTFRSGAQISKSGSSMENLASVSTSTSSPSGSTTTSATTTTEAKPKPPSVNTGPLLYESSGTPASKSQVEQGKIYFDQSCSSCHGMGAEGSSRAPNLVGLGPATIDFWLTTGRMPLSNTIVQPERKPPRYDPSQSLDIVAYVTSLGPGGPLIPNISGVPNASIAEGASLFALNCAGCHTITGAGDELASGAYAPSLHQATPTQVAEAIRTGPANMPRFSPGIMTNRQVNDIVKYVTQSIQHPNNAGGFGLGGVGPVAEGFVGLLIGVGILMLFALWIGDRS
ncbi:MAG: c-type cytochrome [Acidimicrobiales bacterium]|nr:c-type cytochrome [Acidimicrobiales bacterium]